MSVITAFKPGEDDGRLADMLSSRDDRVRCLGRAFASKVGPALEEWLAAERQRGTGLEILIDVVATLGVQHVASVAGHALMPSGDAIVVKLMVMLAEERLPHYIAAVRAAREGGAR